MTDVKPLVTIVIIAYNEERFIAESIESALGQTYDNIEVVVVDDGSKDTTCTIAKRYEPKITVVSQANSGNCSFPRNAGLALAKGEFISFLDADDILLPQKIAKQVELLQKYPDAALVVNDYCNFREQDEQRNHFSTCPLLMSEFEKVGSQNLLLLAGKGADIMLDENFTIASSPLFRASIVQELGGFCTDLYACEDYHLNYRLAREFPMIVNKEVLFKRRLHGLNMSSNIMKMSKYYTLSRFLLMKSENNPVRKSKLKITVKRHAKNLLKICMKSKSPKKIYDAILMNFKAIIA